MAMTQATIAGNHSPQSDALHDEDERDDALGDLPSSVLQRSSLASSSSSLTAAQRRDHSRKHSRIHSRNLSIFFPRPSSEAEREADIILAQDTLNHRPTIELDTRLVGGHEHQSRTQIEEAGPSSAASSEYNSSPTKSRKGHHRRHSVVHAQGEESLHSRTMHQGPQAARAATSGGVSRIDRHQNSTPDITPFNPALLVFGVCQFLLGSFIWWKGQSGDSLATAGMGYLTIFDAFAILGAVATPLILSRRSKRYRGRTPGTHVKVGYGDMRIETLLQFTQTIYLLFAAIYVCKESVEHALLEGSTEDHEEDDVGLHLPIFVLLLSAASATFSNFFLGNHGQLVAAGKLSTLASESTSSRRTTSLRTRHGRRASVLADPAVIAGPFLHLLTNPFSVMILFFNYTLAICAMTLHPLQVAALDKVLAGLQSAAMLYVAFPASKALGLILLQTAPLPHDVQNVQLMRSIRTIEEHPLVSYVSPPNLWQLTPPTIAQTTRTYGKQQVPALTLAKDAAARTPKSAVLICSVDIVVIDKATDSDILDLTRWAWQLLSPSVGAAAGLATGESMRGALRAGEITIQILRQADRNTCHDHRNSHRHDEGHQRHEQHHHQHFH